MDFQTFYNLARSMHLVLVCPCRFNRMLLIYRSPEFQNETLLLASFLIPSFYDLSELRNVQTNVNRKQALVVSLCDFDERFHEK